MKKDNLWLKYTNEEKKKVQEVCDRYKDCLNHGKTERECVSRVIEMAQEKGYKELLGILEKGEPIKAGDKFYAVQMDKSIVLFQIGKKPLSEGMNILGAHIDSPRIDINRSHCMRRTALHILIHIIMAALKSINGLQYLWRFMA